MKLDSMAGDDISIHSSASQENHHNHQHNHSHHHQLSQQSTPQHHLHHQGLGLGFRNSFTSMAYSLPPDLDHHYSHPDHSHNHHHHALYTPPNRSSNEDLQCQCHDMPKFDIQQNDEEFLECQSRNEPRNIRRNPMSLSNVFMHQLESRFAKLFSDKRPHGLRNNASFVSIASTVRDPGPSISRQHSTTRKNPESKQGTVCDFQNIYNLFLFRGKKNPLCLFLI